MSIETAPHQVHSHEFAEQQQFDNIRQGLEAAGSLGFNLNVSMQAEHPNLSIEQIETRNQLVLKTAEGIARELGVGEDFLKKPENAILFTAAADSWVNIETNSADQNKQKKAREKEMLADFLLILSGEDSAFVQSLKDTSPEEARRFVESDIDKKESKDWDDFLDRYSDEETARKVENILSKKGEGSFLVDQRASLNIDENEQPFRVRVIKVGERYDLMKAGVYEKVKWPEFPAEDASPEEKEKYRKESDAAGAELERQQAIAEPYKAAQKEYKDTLEPKHGPMPVAFVHHTETGTELVLRAPQALTLINYFGKDMLLPEDEYDRSDIDRILATIRHEFGHTQKSFLRGAHSQLGLSWEERKAELVSGDKMGYQDVKYMFSGLSMATKIDSVTLIKEAIKEDNVLASVLVKAGNAYGLRIALLLTVSKPLPYEKNPIYAKKFADMRCLIDARDASVLDAPIRELIENNGDAKMKESAANWVQHEIDHGADDEFLDSWFHYRKAHGSAVATRYLQSAVEERRGEFKKSTQP